MADDAEDLDEEALAGEEPDLPESLPVASVPERRDSRRHAGILRRQIGTADVKRRKAEAYIEVHEVGSGTTTHRSEDAWVEESVPPDEIWDENPAEDESGLSEAEKKHRIAKRKLDAEMAWGRRRRRANLWWTLAGGLTLLVLGVLLGRADRKRAPSAEIVEPERFESDIALSQTAVAELLVVGHESLPLLAGLMAKAQGEPAAVAPVVAGGTYTAALLPDWRLRTGLVPGVKDDGVIGLRAYILDGDAYLLMTGLRNDYSQYVAYFVLDEAGELRLDWKATVGFSEVLPHEIPEMEAAVSKLMRVVASPSSFYTTYYPESDYECFLVSHLDQERYAWAYVQRDSPVHRRLIGALSVRLTRLTAGRVTIVVRRGAPGSLPNQVLIEDVIGADWISVRGGD